MTTSIATCTDARALLSTLEREVAEMIVETLQLEVAAAEIAPEEPLFHDGLGLDSIDALEIALALGRRYGVDIKSNDARNTEIFANLRNLCAFVEQNRKG